MKSIKSSPATRDSGRVVLGAAGRLPAVKPATTADNGKVKLGAAGRLPAIRG